MMMTYKLLFSDASLKMLSKIDKHHAKLIYAWLVKNIDGCADPRIFGKALSHDRKGEWRYRIGKYRVVVDIRDYIVVVEVLLVGHRKNIYE